MAHQFEIISWQGLLQYVSKNLISRGYYYWHLTELPIHKQNKWGEIDKKLITKYQTNKTKFQRHRRKAKGEANFIYVRWGKLALIFHTEGAVPDDVDYSDNFFDIRQSPIFLQVGDETTFVIELAGNGKAHIKLDKDTYQGLKACIFNTAKRQNPEILKRTFQIVNGFPSYSGILKQKKMLRDYCVKQAKKNMITIKTKDKSRSMQGKDFWIYSKAQTVEVFKHALGVNTKACNG